MGHGRQEENGFGFNGKAFSKVSVSAWKLMLGECHCYER